MGEKIGKVEGDPNSQKRGFNKVIIGGRGPNGEEMMDLVEAVESGRLTESMKQVEEGEEEKRKTMFDDRLWYAQLSQDFYRLGERIETGGELNIVYQRTRELIEKANRGNYSATLEIITKQGKTIELDTYPGQTFSMSYRDIQRRKNPYISMSGKNERGECDFCDIDDIESYKVFAETWE